jgi:hypothetical protein
MTMKNLLVIALFFGFQLLSAQVEPKISDATGQVGQADDSHLYNVAAIEQKPEFPGGLQNFYKFVMNNYHMPDHPEMQSGNVMVAFVVEKDGSITDVRAVRDVGFGSGEEAVRVIEKSPKWTPGVQNGKNVRVSFMVPIKIMVTEPEPIYAENEVKTKPQFPGGEKALQAFFKKNYNGKGTITVNFVIEADGLPTFIKCDDLDANSCSEVKRVMISAPRWKAGKKDGWLVRVQMTRTFTIE